MAFNGPIPIQILDSSGNSITNTVDGLKNAVDVSLVNSSVPGTPTVYNVTMATANTEYNFVIPANTKKLVFKTRNSSKSQFAFTSGQSGTNYMTLPAGTSYTLEGMNTNSVLTLYFQSPTASETLEIISWY